MVDPINFTDFNRSVPELEEVALFGLLVAGKNAESTAKALHMLLGSHVYAPFEFLRLFSQKQLAKMLLAAGIGCYNNKSRSIYELVHSGLDLRTCTAEEMEEIYGIGPKTSRLFIHSGEKTPTL